MIGYFVPLKNYPAGYGGDPTQPLPFIGLASQKNYMALYLMYLYSNDKTEKTFRQEWKKTGKKLDMGKSCVRFKELDDLPLDVIGKSIASVPVNDWIDVYDATRQAMKKKRAAKKKTKKRASKKKR